MLKRTMSVHIGEQVALLRLRRGWNRAELARAAGISWNALEMVETGKVQPKLETLEKLFTALGYKAEISEQEQGSGDNGNPG